MNKKISIIGAGISGLIAAYELEQAGWTPTIYEATDRIGGRVKTDYIDGYPYDQGFQVLLSAYPEAQKYLDYETLDLQPFLSGSRVINGKNVSKIGDPIRSPGFWLSAFDMSLASLGDKLKTLKLSQQLKSKSIKAIFNEEEITTSQYLKNKGFSDKVIERFFKPFFGGIFLEMNLTTSSRLFEFLFKMFASGYSMIPQGGMQKISDQLAAKLSKTDIHFNTKIKEVHHDKLILQDGSQIESPITIIATDPSNISNQSQQTDWKGSTNYYYEVDKPSYKESIITLSANPDKLINNFYYPTNLIPHPEGKTILSTTVVDSQGLSSLELEQAIRQELTDLGLNLKELVTSYNIPQSLPELSNIKYELTDHDITVSSNVYACGDHLLMGSLNAAMYAGHYVAQHIISKY